MSKMRQTILTLLLCLAMNVTAQVAPFTYRKSDKADLHICEMTGRQVISQEPHGALGSIIYQAQVDCSGSGMKAGSIGFRLLSVTAPNELRKMADEMARDSLKEREDVTAAFTLDNGETLLFDSVFVANQSTPALADLIVVVDLLGVRSDVVGQLEMSALTHAYLVRRFSKNNIVKMTIAGHVVPFNKWQTAPTIHDMFQTIFEKTGSNIYNPELKGIKN